MMFRLVSGFIYSAIPWKEQCLQNSVQSSAKLYIITVLSFYALVWDFQIADAVHTATLILCCPATAHNGGLLQYIKDHKNQATT